MTGFSWDLQDCISPSVELVDEPQLSAPAVMAVFELWQQRKNWRVGVSYIRTRGDSFDKQRTVFILKLMFHYDFWVWDWTASCANILSVRVKPARWVNIQKPLYYSGWLTQHVNVLAVWIPRGPIKNTVKSMRWSGGLEEVQGCCRKKNLIIVTNQQFQPALLFRAPPLQVPYVTASNYFYLCEAF